MTSPGRMASIRDKVSPDEWAVRVDLAACYRLVAHYGWEDLVFCFPSASTPSSCSRASGTTTSRGRP